jgi:hypothetical protein
MSTSKCDNKNKDWIILCFLSEYNVSASLSYLACKFKARLELNLALWVQPGRHNVIHAVEIWPVFQWHDGNYVLVL